MCAIARVPRARILTLKGHGRNQTLKGRERTASRFLSAAGVAVGGAAMEDCGREHCDTGVAWMCCRCHTLVSDHARTLLMKTC